MSEYRYILAPNNLNNFQVVRSIIEQFSELISEKRVKTAYRRSPEDVVDNEGSLLTPADPQGYIYVKIDITAITPEQLESILSGVMDVETFTRENQPFAQFWI